MPGLMGIVRISDAATLNEEQASTSLERMVAALSHRKDYVTERLFKPRQGMFLVRLGHPFMIRQTSGTKEESVKLTGNGLLYGVVQENGQDRTSFSDIRTVAASQINQLKGFFSLAFLEQDAARVVVAVDKRAAEPIYYTEHKGNLYFAPEVKALLAGCDISRQPDDSALALFITSGHLLGHQTLFNSVKKLPGGHALVVENERVNVIEYWRFMPGLDVDQTSREDLANELGDLVYGEVARNLGDPGQTRIFMSGGADSRGILGAALETVGGNGNKLHTISWGISRNAQGSDPQIADQFARDYHLNHKFVERSTANYENWFEQANYLIDAMADVAAFHPQEHIVMEQIRSDGYHRVLRGDETFGWRWQVYSLLGALSNVGFRRFRSVEGLSSFIRDNHYARIADAGDAVVDTLLQSCKDMEPNNARDYLYFTHRIQTYLGAAGYYKQVHLDHRNPLLGDTILEFLARVPPALRHDKLLFREALQKRYPELWSYPFENCPSLENWKTELSLNSPLQQYMTSQFSDTSSGIWEYFDHAEMKGLLNSVVTVKAGPISLSVKKSAKNLARRVIERTLPSVASNIEAVRKQKRRIENYKILMRVVALKNWYDKFVS